MAGWNTVATIGYANATGPTLLAALTGAGVEIVVDVRAIAGSRRPGFAKRKLSEALAGAGMEYLHLPGLGTPAEGRAAARRGDLEELRRIYHEHLETLGAMADLDHLAALVGEGRRLCLLCLEADPAQCHRSMVAAALAHLVPIHVIDLSP